MKILLVMFTAILCGCAPQIHVGTWDDSYYKQEIRNSKNVLELKKFLVENKMIQSDIAITDNKPNGNYSRIVIDGSTKSYVTPETSKFVNSIANSLSFLELGSHLVIPKDLYKLPAQKDGKYFNTVFCTDLSHSNLSSNLDGLTLPITYMLTNASKEDLIEGFSLIKYWDCDGYEFGNIIYKKTVTLTSSLNSAKIKYQFQDGENSLSDQDKMNLLIYDVVSQGVLVRLSDLDLVKAWKEFLKF
jgi:hypothetical protein